jgi:cephalosporin hydroxylase/glycosyltransferase involved in cell wall biosynthesis
VVGSAPEFDSYVDGVTARRAWGWCWFPEHPQQVAAVRVRAGTSILARMRADQFRQDLADAGKGNGACAFDIALPPLVHTRALSLQVELEDGRPLCNAVHELPAPPDGPEAVTPADQHGSTWPLRLIGVEGCLEWFGRIIRGWVAPGAMAPARLSICEGDSVLFAIDASQWRSDLEDAHQGDGRGGFELPVPAMLLDGEAHLLDIRIGTESVLHEPLWVRLDAAPALPAAAAARTISAPSLTRRLGSVASALSPLHFSFIVNFYNMRREAERTLTSLTRAYQRDAEEIRYEVICVDNGSNPPLDEAWVSSFGPEFRLVRPSKILSSPCFAINEAAARARGRHVAIVIDGAHVLSPGVLREAKAAIDEDSDTVVALRHWFVGGDQRWLNAVGYTREQEDILFARARWPGDGYELFEISTPMSENPNHWFDPIAESNCLFLPMTLWHQMGGLDVAFDEAGGGFCNLDLLRRAASGKARVIVLLGEATFHQYHEGTTTNVSDEAKDARVRSYASRYRALRGKEFANLATTQFRIRGQMQHYSAYGTRQRPSFNAPLGVTTRVRPGALERWIDVGSLQYLNGAYVESGLQEFTTWRGQRLSLAPADLTAMQDILFEQRPDRIVITASEPALVSFLDDVARLLDLSQMRIVCVVDQVPAEPHARVDYVAGPPYAASTLSAVAARLGLAESVLVLFSRREDDFFPLEPLRAYARFVSFRSYLIVLRTVLGQPWLGYSKYWLRRVVFLFEQQSDFVVDETRTQHVITLCSGGYLTRAKPPLPRPEDDALDQLAS